MSDKNNLEIVPSKIEQVVISGDLAGLTSEERVQYHVKVCESLGLNALTKPFEYIKLNGKLQLYAKKDATDQLRRIDGISISISNKEQFDNIYMVTAQAKDKSGRQDESTGIVDIKGLSGQNLANAYMKAETKAKRRVTLSICGLGMLDETEVEDISKAGMAKDVSPEKNQPFLPAPEEQHDALIQAFMGIGVTKSEILKYFQIAGVNQLGDDHIELLREIFKNISEGIDKGEFFNKGE